VHHSALDAGETGEPIAFAVHRMEIDFKRPARIDDVVEVVTRPKEVRGARILLSQTIRRGSEVLIEAVVTVVLINRAGRAQRIPESLAARFAAAPE
jgi:acyl-CoA thioester hydrolase